MKQNKKLRMLIVGALVLALLISGVAIAVTTQPDGKSAEAANTSVSGSPLLSNESGLVPEGETAGIAPEPIPDPSTTPDEPQPTNAPQGDTGTQPTDPLTEPATDDIAPASAQEQTEAAQENVVNIGAVRTINRSDPAEGMIRLDWDAAEGAKGYHIYWHDVDDADESFTLLSTVKDTSLTIRNLQKGCMYYFKVAGYNTVDGTLYEGESATLKAGTTPVGVSTFYLASGVPTGTLLRWERNDLCDGYVMYRQFDGKWSRYQVLPRDVTEFRDTDVIPGRAYNYRLSTYRMDAAGELLSAPSTVRTICGLCAPADNGTTTMLRKMYFKWKKNAYAHGYEIRYSSDGTNYTLLTDTTATSYTSNRFIVGKTYHFRIYPYRILDGKKIYGTCWARTLTMTNSAYGRDVGNTYIEVNIAQQHMWYYINGELYVSTDVVTGNYNTADTPKGYWEVNDKVSPCTLIGADYVSYVDYWIAFIGSGYGIHDASWRSTFGGQIYKGNGSHGCINTPYANVKKIYGKVTIGTPVIVY